MLVDSLQTGRKISWYHCFCNVRSLKKDIPLKFISCPVLSDQKILFSAFLCVFFKYFISTIVEEIYFTSTLMNGTKKQKQTTTTAREKKVAEGKLMLWSKGHKRDGAAFYFYRDSVPFLIVVKFSFFLYQYLIFHNVLSLHVVHYHTSVVIVYLNVVMY